jgi:hypothetical protein
MDRSRQLRELRARPVGKGAKPLDERLIGRMLLPHLRGA